MNAGNNDVTNTEGRSIVIERSFNHPREAVFAAWADPARIGLWWGPHGYTTTVYEMDVRPGGIWRYVMHGPDGTDYKNKVTYLEVAQPVRLVYLHGDDSGNESGDFHVTVTFTERGKATDVRMYSVFDSAETVEKLKQFGVVEGGQQTLERLDAHLASLGGLGVSVQDMEDTVDLSV